MNTNLNQPPQETEDGELSDAHQFVTFLIGEDVFAVDMEPVQEIIRVPGVVRVPLAPSSLDGLSNLRGKVLPIISLRRIFSITDKPYDDSTRAIVIDMGQALGFVVDRVASVINVEPEKIEDATGIKSTINSNLLIGILKNVSGYSMVMVLDFNKIIANEFSGIESLIRGVNTQHLAQSEDAEDDDELFDERQLVSFSVAGQEYAVDITNVQEIVQIPESIVHVPKADTHVLGIMNLRDRLLPLVSLRSLFHLPDQPLDERSRVVVVALHGMSVGVVTDSVSEVLRVPLDFIDPIPPLLAKDESLSDITQICRLQQGKRIVSIISTENMFKHSTVVQAIQDTDQMIDQDAESDSSELLDDDEEQVVVFHLADGEFGVPIQSVQEIVRIPDELTHVPKAPAFIEGVINLRGAVLPVIDQRKRLGMPALERNDRQRIMVFSINGMRTGFIVDAVTEVLKIPKKSIEASPKLSADQAQLLGRVANLELQKRMIQLIDPAYLVDQQDHKALADAAA